MTENQLLYFMEDVTSHLKVEYLSNINIQMRNNYSSPYLMSLFSSFHQTDIPLDWSILWHFSFQSVFPYAVIGLQALRIYQAMTSRFRRRSIRHFICVLSVQRTTKLVPHSIVLFYDISHLRAYSNRQSLAFGYSLPARRWQAGFGHDHFATWHDCPLSVCLPNWRPTLLFYSMTFPNSERIPIRSHWPSGTSYSPGDDKQGPTTFNSPPGMTVLFRSVYQTDAPLCCF